ncbi:unnamed protein product [Rhizophagus irregularis]|nr:unnamed protein product [Rhizophagus irregularis]
MDEAPPPPPKPKPPKLATMVSNKVDSDPISSKKVNTNGRGSNVHRLSSVFEDNDKNLKPRMGPSLPLSPRLPVPTVTLKKQKSFSREKVVNNNLNPEIDESPLAFGDIKARFQQAQVSDGTLPNPSKKPAALADLNKTTKSTKSTKNTERSQITKITSERIRIMGTSQPPPAKTKKPKPLRFNSSNDVTSTKKQVSEDFEGKKGKHS